MRSWLVLFAVMSVGCGSRTIGDGFDIDTRVVEDGAVVDTGSSSTDGAVSSDSTPVDPGTDGGTVEPSATIRCGADTCVASSEDCCVSGGGGGGSADCRPKGTCGRGLALSCSSPASCGGQACCLVVRDGGGTATCQPTCAGGRETQRLCETDADCTMGRRCRNAMFAGLRVCF